MALQTLVDTAKEDGKFLLEKLKQDGFSIDSAFWYYADEKWMLVIESYLVNEKGPRAAYGKLIASMRDLKDKNPSFSLDSIDVHLVKRDDRIARRLHDAAKDGLVRRNERFTGVTKWGYVEDSYVYFIGEPAAL